MNKKLIFIIVILIGVTLLAKTLMSYTPRTIINGSYSMAYDVKRTNSKDGSSTTYEKTDNNAFVISRIMYKKEDVTDKFNPEEVAKLLSSCMSKRDSMPSLKTSDKIWEIDVIYRDRPIHICLGQKSYDSNELINYWYEPSKPEYKILDPDLIMNKLENIMEDKLLAEK